MLRCTFWFPLYTVIYCSSTQVVLPASTCASSPVQICFTFFISFMFFYSSQICPTIWTVWCFILLSISADRTFQFIVFFHPAHPAFFAQSVLFSLYHGFLIETKTSELQLPAARRKAVATMVRVNAFFMSMPIFVMYSFEFVQRYFKLRWQLLFLHIKRILFAKFS